MLLVAGCSGSPRAEKFDPPHTFFSFESGMEGWEPRGLDLALGQGEIPWSIAPDIAFSSDGSSSLKAYLANYNDAGKIFIQRSFQFSANANYAVTVRFDLGSADSGDVGLFRVIAGAFPKPPQLPQELKPAFRDSTGNGRSSPGLVWLAKSYRDVVQTDLSGRIVVVVGVWGTFETPRTYYLDAVEVDFAEQ